MAGVLGELEPVLSQIVVTRNSSPRAMDVPTLAELAGEVFGADRVHAAAGLDDAIDLAVRLADEAEAGDLAGQLVPGSAGVLITGSVLTAGEARLLLATSASGPAASRGTAG